MTSSKSTLLELNPDDLKIILYDLGLRLSSVTDLKKGFRLCLETAIEASGMDSGGIYLVDEESGALELVYHKGLTKGFIQKTSYYGVDSPNAKMVASEDTIYTTHRELEEMLSVKEKKEGLKALAVIPIQHKGKVVACLNVASHDVKEIPLKARNVLESMASQIGSTIIRLKTEEVLQSSLAESEHNKRLLLALGHTSKKFLKAKTVEEIYEIVGAEVAKLDFHTVIFRLSDTGKRLYIPYTTLKSDIVRASERLARVKAADYEIGIKTGSVYDNVINKKETLFLPSIIKPLEESLPKITRPVAKQILKILKLKQAIYAPLMAGEKVFGLIIVTGSDLTESDIPAVSVFASQVAAALESVRLNKETRQSEELYRTIFNNSPIGIAHVNMDGHPQMTNRSLQMMLGYSEEEFSKMHFTKFTYPDDVDKYMSLFKELISGKRDYYQMEKRYIRKDEQLVWGQHNVSLIKDDDGKPQNVISMVEDITERKISEKEREKLAERLSLATNAAGIGIWDWNVKDNELIWDKSMFDLYGVKKENIKGAYEVWKKGIHPEDLQDADNEVQSALDGKKVFNTEFRIVKPDGSIHFIRGVADVYRDENDNPVRMVGVNWDITNLKKTEVELLKHKENLEAEVKKRTQQLSLEKDFSETVINSLPGIFYMFDKKGRFIRWNKNLEEISRYSSKEIAKMSHLHFFTGETKKRIASKILEVFTKGSASVEGELVTKTGKVIPFYFTGIRLKVDKKHFLIGVGFDISEQKKAEMKLKQTLDDLMRSNEELERFAYVASHDLQEPLRMVSSYTQLLEKRYEDKLDSTAKEFISYAVDGSQRMQTLLQDLLAFSRVGTRGKSFIPIDCEQVLKEAVSNLNLSIRDSDAEITHDSLPPVRADKQQLTQLFQNLIDNAIKFRNENKPKVHVSAKTKDDEWIFSVKDNGIGIDPKYYDKIFVIFQRLNGKNNFSGTGLGLALCKKIVERHGGKIWVESQLKKGSTFYFTLPTRGGKNDERKRMQND
jgi:PAS domain S-box-containing protein